MPAFNIKIEELYKAYNGDRYVLKGINLSVDEGEMILIKGRSGSGKTTLLDLIGCIDVPTKGRILLNGFDTSQLSQKELAEIRLRTIGILFQSHNLIKDLTVFDNILLPLKIAGLKDGAKRVYELLQTFDLTGIEHSKPNEISGGEQQRVAIARALANNPSLLLADEPTSSLDAENCEIVIESFKKVNREFRTTVIIASHDPLLDEHVQKRFRLHEGKLSEE